MNVGRKTVGILQMASAVVLISLSILVLIHLNDVNVSRRDSARDSCQLFRGLVLRASSVNKTAVHRAEVYIHETPLHDCAAYARRIVP